MKICHISRALCSRMVKLAYAQQHAGHQTYWVGENLITYQKTIPFLGCFIGQGLRFGGIEGHIRNFNKIVDIFHVHTHIKDTHLLDIEQTATKPWVWDCHDLPEYPATFYPDFSPTESLGGEVYRTYCPEDWFATPKVPNNNIAIATGLSNIPGNFRYWFDVFKDITKQHLLICFSESDVFTVSAYNQLGYNFWKMNVDIRAMIEQISHCKAGLCGSPYPDKNMLSAFPNKLFEYMAAGIPAICFGRKHEMAAWIEDNGVGTSIDDVSELSKALKYLEDNHCRQRVWEIRSQLTMESQLPRVMGVYDKILTPPQAA